MTATTLLYEYKTISLPFPTGVFMKGTPDVAAALNSEAQQGWRLQQIIMPQAGDESGNDILAILERQL